MTTIQPSPSSTQLSENPSHSADKPLADSEGSAGAPEISIGSSAREELIRQAAYRRYLERGTQAGGDVDDWIAAEAEINQSFVE